MKGKIEFLAHLAVFSAGAMLILYLFFKYALGIFLPFIIALASAEATRPLARRISARIGAPERLMRVLLCVLIVITLLTVFIGAVSFILGEAWSLLREIAAGGAVGGIFDSLAALFPEGGELRKYALDALNAALSGLLSRIGAAVTSFAGGLPRALLFVLVTVLATFYFALDIERINKFLYSLMPKSLHGWLVRHKGRIIGSFLSYLRAYLLLTLVTFAEIFLGFVIIGVDYAALIAALTAVLDALPLIGVGAILIPMAAYNFLIGEGSRAIGLAVLFMIHTVIRQIIEPRIVGKNLGIHPIVSLAIIYFCYQLFGAVGILLVPVFSVLINALVNKDDSPEIA